MYEAHPIQTAISEDRGAMIKSDGLDFRFASIYCAKDAGSRFPKYDGQVKAGCDDNAVVGK